MSDEEYRQVFCEKHELTPEDCEFFGLTLQDIMFDINTDLPEEVFDKWLESTEDSEWIGYFDWLTKTDIKYIPDIDNSAIGEFVDDVEKSIDIMKNEVNRFFETLGYTEDSDFDDFEDEEDDGVEEDDDQDE